MMERLPKEHQTLFFSATVSGEIKGLINEFLKNPVTISVITAHQQSAALMAAGVDLGVFNALGEGPRTAAKLAVKVGVPERGMRIPCDYLACHSQLNN